MKMPRFSIKWLLVLTAVAAIALTGWRIYSERYRRTALAVAELRYYGASVESVHFELPWWQSWLLGSKYQTRIVAVRSHDMHSGGHFFSWSMPRNHDLDDRTLRACGLVDSIEAIWLRETKITSDGLKYLADKQHLRELHVDNTAIDDRGLQYLANLHQLKELCLDQTQVTDAGLAVLTNFPELTALQIGSPHLSDASAAHVWGLKHLYELSIRGPEITDRFLEKIKDLKGVVRLRIVGTQITGRGLRHLKNWRRLKELELVYNRIGDEGLDVLAALPELYYLTLAEPDVTDGCTASLQEIRRLKTVHLNHSGITEAGANELRATFPKAHVMTSQWATAEAGRKRRASLWSEE